MTVTSRLRAATLPLALSTAASMAATPARAESPPYPQAFNGDGAVTNGYSLSRWAEDWTSKADPESRDDPLDRLKYIPLDSDGDVYLTLSGELRLRVNHTTNPNLRDAEAQRQDINRIVGGADLHVGKHLRFYGELAHGGIAGENIGTPTTSQRNDLVVQQAFVEGMAEVGGVDVGVRYGRQEFVDGPNLLVTQRDNNTIRYTLNGWRFYARGSKLRFGAFDFRPTSYGDKGLGDDQHDPARRFSGATVGVMLPKTILGNKANLAFDTFLWRRSNDLGAWGGRVGPATRYYLGGWLRGDIGRVNLDWSVNRQWGHYIDQDISAWHAFIAQTYRIGEAKTAPRVGVHVDYATGGGGYGDGKLRNGYAPFGNNVYYSYQTYLTASNMLAVTPNFSFSPFKGARLLAEYEFAYRDNVNDAVYRANGQPFAGTQNFHARKIAELARLQLTWTITPRLSFTGRYEHLDAGPALTDAGYKSSDFLAGWLSYRF
ncbi:hypothetical protein A8V01_01630 [Novosphingobium guangzhouense]|uniref:Alginate export domain-containing protein n=1 Tax=Novosphingobium guangzhouense TaxID=1850347 RepID=A0A2K2G6B8_9SPHN|nr:hypothetical protein A8V01_01630 [Novosphingobium guangzhouense]